MDGIAIFQDGRFPSSLPYIMESMNAHTSLLPVCEPTHNNTREYYRVIRGVSLNHGEPTPGMGA